MVNRYLAQPRTLPAVAALLVGLAVAAAIWSLGRHYDAQRLAQQRVQFQQQLQVVGARLEASVQRRLALVQGLVAFSRLHIEAGQPLEKRAFQEFAGELQKTLVGVRNLVLAPGGVVQFRYPPASINGAPRDDSLWARPQVGAERDQAGFTLSNPGNLLSSAALVGRLPIFFHKAGAEVYWGYAGIELDLQPLFAEAGLNQQMVGVPFALRGRNSAGTAGDVFFGHSDLFGADSVVIDVSLPSGSWQLAARPAEGWAEGSSIWLLSLGAGLVFSLVALTYWLLRYPPQERERLLQYARGIESQVEAQLHTQKLVSALLDETPELICCKNLAGQYLCCNQAYAEHLGMSKEQLVGWKDEELFPGVQSEDCPSLATPVGSIGEERTHETWVMSADGRRLFLKTRRVALRGVTGETEGVIFVSRDYTERKRLEQAQAVSAQRHRFLVEGLDDAVFRVDLATGEFQYMSATAIQVFGHPAACFTDNPHFFRELLLPKSQPEYAAYWQQLVESNSPQSIDYAVRGEEGRVRWIRQSAVVVHDTHGQAEAVEGVCRDVTQLRDALQAESVAASIFANSTEAIVVTDAQNRIVRVNPAFTAISGYTAAEVLGRDPGLLASGQHNAEFYTQMKRSLEQEQRWEGEIWNRRKSGEIYPEWLTIVKVMKPTGDLDHYVALFSDISRHKEAEGLLYRQANYDRLTGLPNRLLAMDRLAACLQGARRAGSQAALLYIGLDRFKWINDTYGHQAGDRLLKEAAGRLKEVVGEPETVARLSGDEFLVILPDIRSGYDIEHIASAIGQRLAKPYQLAEREAYVTASIGIALCPDDAEQAEQLLHHASSAMWRAKEGGANRYRFFTNEMNEEVQARARLESDLRLAILNEEFEVYYQPLVSIESGRVTGAEALVRWQHPEKGLVYPGCFIPLAEETGLIVPIGTFVLRQVCEQLIAWERAGRVPLRVSVNLSPKQCLSRRGLEQIRSLIQETGVDTRYLVLEITESMLIEEEASLDALRQLRGMGIRLALDDFGTGYSSLSYLKHFPIDILKIDRSFVGDLPREAGDVALVEAMLAMARSLELEVVAEGVENQAQRDFLADHHCDYIQGFYFARPMPPVAFEAFVNQYNGRGG